MYSFHCSGIWIAANPSITFVDGCSASAHNLALRRRYRTRRDALTQMDAGSEERTVDPAPNPEDRLANRQAQTC